MAKPAFDRDGVLSPDERVASAQKCLDLLNPEADRMSDSESGFVGDMANRLSNFGSVSERQLAWLRDLVSKYAT